jgi:hypothetical protein
MAKTVAPLSPVAQAILDLMKAEGRPLTLAEVRDLGIADANSAHFVALRNRGFLTSEKVTREEMKLVKSEVNVYTLIDAE